jgi:hypothetical protein
MRRLSPISGNSTSHGGLHGVHLFLDPQVALAITEVAEHGPHRSVDLGDVLTQEVGSPDALHVTSRVRKARQIRGPRTSRRVPSPHFRSRHWQRQNGTGPA